jgi:pyruvate formate lyase activating enzyme
MDKLEEREESSRMPVIYNIQRYALQDGPGFRTTVFVKGCPLRCPWCHNPETQNSEKELLFDREKCVSCGACAEVCPTGAAAVINGEIVQDNGKCILCGKCVETCAPGARTVCGMDMVMDDIVREAKKDELFFQSSDGGVTISGGDPLFFPEFTTELAKRLHDEMIHVAVDTAAFCKWEYLEGLLRYTDLFLVDLKTMDEQKYHDIIKASLPAVRRNLENLLEAGASVRVRIPVIPGFNDTEKDYDAFSEYLGFLRAKGLEGVDILPFHSYAGKKYKLSGRWENYKFKDTESLQAEDVKSLASRLKQKGFSGADSSLTIGALTGKRETVLKAADAS